jgi:hypothetical protein
LARPSSAADTHARAWAPPQPRKRGCAPPPPHRWAMSRPCGREAGAPPPTRGRARLLHYSPAGASTRGPLWTPLPRGLVVLSSLAAMLPPPLPSSPLSWDCSIGRRGGDVHFVCWRGDSDNIFLRGSHVSGRWEKETKVIFAVTFFIFVFFLT